VGEPDDFRQAPLGEDARRVAETLLASGLLPAAVLREPVGVEGRRGGTRFLAAVVELGRALVCTSFGTEQVGAGWPSVVLELTVRVFDLCGGEADDVARRQVARCFLDTMLVASAGELASVRLAARRCRRRAGGTGGARRSGGGGGLLPAPRIAPHAPKTTLGVLVEELEDRVLVAQLLPLAIHGFVSAWQWKSMRRMPTACLGSQRSPRRGEGECEPGGSRAAARPADWGLSSAQVMAAMAA
jgi:hypothetical protein